MKPVRQAAIKEMLTRLEHRQSLLQEKCAEWLVAENQLSQEMADRLSRQWVELVVSLKKMEEIDWQQQALRFGAWCAAQKIPFDTVITQLHYYKRAATPWLVREYPGVEGYLEAHLALDEALTLLMGKIPEGYYRASESDL
uniref:Uncharacterized protein n=1 Tax=uncultured Chloroflexota bacterium TaxID=166587 RepID=H5SN38_9CHLR|nr:hypothetical protein HGMM_F51E07C19 [uncultured Chloroflexota bacterium]